MELANIEQHITIEASLEFENYTLDILLKPNYIKNSQNHGDIALISFRMRHQSRMILGPLYITLLSILA